MDIFHKRVIASQEPQAGPSGDIQEESIVFIGDDSSTCVTALIDLPVVQDVAVEDSDIAETDPV